MVASPSQLQYSKETCSPPGSKIPTLMRRCFGASAGGNTRLGRFCWGFGGGCVDRRDKLLQGCVVGGEGGGLGAGSDGGAEE